MRKLRLLWIALALLLACTAVAEGSAPAKVGAQGPDFEVTTLDGETFRLSDQRGKAVFLNIWATWCPPCVEEMPDIQKLSQAHPDELVVIGLSCDDSAETVAEFVQKNGYTYTFAMDEDYRIGNLLYPTQYIPQSVFIDPNGIVTSIEVGMASYDEMERRFQAALANGGN